ncbi:MAG: hypothetical protein IPK58_09530 [Acidobacteria bacterium]|nr:hypothetical protein [Acidobacteriota bacterium]
MEVLEFLDGPNERCKPVTQVKLNDILAGELSGVRDLHRDFDLLIRAPALLPKHRSRARSRTGDDQAQPHKAGDKRIGSS